MFCSTAVLTALMVYPIEIFLPWPSSLQDNSALTLYGAARLEFGVQAFSCSTTRCGEVLSGNSMMKIWDTHLIVKQERCVNEVRMMIDSCRMA